MFLHHVAEKNSEWLDGWHIEPILVGSGICVVLFCIAALLDPAALWNFLIALITLAPFWLPPFLVIVFWVSWMHYIRYKFWFGWEYILLEIQLPPEVEKSPLAMETFLTAMHNAGGETTYIARIWRGTYRAVWSLEIASNGGKIGYYIHTRKDWRSQLEARLYGLFPEAKVTQVKDYVTQIPFNLNEYDIFGAEYQKPKSSPHALPIKTYINYGMDKDPKEENKVDPIANVLELLGQVGPGEHYWFQIIIKARKYDEWYGFYDTKHDAYKDSAKKEIQNIMANAAVRAKDVLKASEVIDGKMNALLTDGEKRRIDALERAVTKPTFECGLRVLYIAKKENFRGINIPPLIQFMSVFSGNGNEVNRMHVTRGLAFFDYPWQDFREIRKTIIKKLLFFYYRHRAYFYVPYDQAPVFLNIEELATIWHFPGSSIKTPGLNRVPSRQAEAPTNLPTLSS